MASGDQANTSRKPSGKKRKRLSQKKQSERFKETARKLDADQTGKEFEQVLAAIMPAKQKPRN